MGASPLMTVAVSLSRFNQATSSNCSLCLFPLIELRCLYRNSAYTCNASEIDLSMNTVPALLDLLDALVEEKGRFAAARALRVSYRTMTNCLDSRRVSRRMWQALEKFRDEQEAGESPDGDDVDSETEAAMEALGRRVAALEEENRRLREIVEEQGDSGKPSERGEDSVGERERRTGEGEPVGIGDGQEGRQSPRRRSGLADVVVVTLEAQPDEGDASGPATPLVVKWRELRAKGEATGNGVEHAQAAVRRWELEVAMIGEFHLTLPPETESLDDARRDDHLRWRRDALTEARRELTRAKLMRLLRRALTLGLWWK